jgi:V/A-type H+-transporting ATPase subunit B
MPAGDITHPVPDLTGYITEGQIVLSAEVASRGRYPPVDALSSLSRLQRKGAGPGRTREDHLPLAAQLLAALARSQEVRGIAELVGAASLGPVDQRYLAFRDRLETCLIDQGRDEVRTLDQTLDAGWRALADLPREELTMIPTAVLDARLPTGTG